jgi:predicted MPP superfamily phosphohydrolase
MKPIYFILIFVAYSLVCFYISFRGWQVLPGIKIVKISYIVLMVFLSYGYILGAIFHKHIPAGIAKSYEIICSTWMIAAIYLLLAVLFFDLLRLLNHWLHFLPPLTLLMRQMAALSALGIIAVLFVIGYVRFMNPTVEKIEISVPNEHAPIKSLKMVVVSDLHLGNTLGKKQLQRYVNLINEQEPDLIVIAGDLLNGDLKPLLKQEMDKELLRLNAPLGTFAVLGNHEYIGGDVGKTLKFLESCNIKCLRDSVWKIDDLLVIIGRDDRHNRNRLPLEKLCEQIENEQNLPVILLDHQPFQLEEAVANNIALMLSGHTHDGQIWPISLVVRSMYEVAHGYKKRENTHFYVSSGLGIWGAPFRIGTRSEVVVIGLRFQ